MASMDDRPEPVKEPTYQVAYGDVDLTYGAVFVRDQGDGWAEVVEVTDLDSACGTTNLILVEQGTVTIPYRLAAAREAFRRAWEACGPGACDRSLTGMDRRSARRAAFAALWEFGEKDVEKSWTIATDRDYSEWAGADRWRVSRQEVPARGKSNGPEKWLRPIVVNGEKGLRRWLRAELEVEA